MNIEVLGFGSDEDLKNLQLKIEKEYDKSKEIRQNETTQLVTNKFNKEMFFGIILTLS